eukprot:CAMPEP_0119327394 /NCGR_PEP_ID=MMETSP1333-20130426/70676_1 /TAXON_ID=418940 /ORGANISM="Scyphosphaera apsteinii, Strain RCC1455" /LENGTH=137 /DNA_ID=CAMNT_0007335973 /DNA_START=394 /DNA_END=805 /DNA_ORIENTATION=+
MWESLSATHITYICDAMRTAANALELPQLQALPLCKRITDEEMRKLLRSAGPSSQRRKAALAERLVELCLAEQQRYVGALASRMVHVASCFAPGSCAMAKHFADLADLTESAQGQAHLQLNGKELESPMRTIERNSD